MLSELETTPYYWSASDSRGEIDFIVQHDGNVIPIEVKAEENLNAKSLKAFISKYDLPMSVRTSMSDYRRQEAMVNLPLYAISELYAVM
jgi:hypothetical protein